jgi:N-acetylglucosaminyl-diphospho-decaprenol L-rhamnosyltransferase
MMYEYDLSIIVISWNGRELLDECLTALRKSKDSLRKQIILVDNGSTDGTDAFIRASYPEVELIRSAANLGFTRANNLAFECAKGKYVLMLNSDAFISPDAIQRTVDFMEKKKTPALLEHGSSTETAPNNAASGFFPPL